MFLATRIRPLARTIPRTALGAQRPVWATAAARGFQSSALRFNTAGQDTDSTAKTAAVSSLETEKEKETTAGKTEQEPEEPASEGEITARAYDFRMSPTPSSFVASMSYLFPRELFASVHDNENRKLTQTIVFKRVLIDQLAWLYNGSSHLTRIPHYPYAKAPKVWALLGWVPQSIQYAVCKSACERMLRNNTSPEYFPDQFLQGGERPLLQCPFAIRYVGGAN